MSGAAASTGSGEGQASPSAAASLLEDEDCGFCVYMRAGPCGAERPLLQCYSCPLWCLWMSRELRGAGDEFRAWEDCVKTKQAKGDDFAVGCMATTRLLTECMVKHKDYYEAALPEGAAQSGDRAEPGAS